MRAVSYGAAFETPSLPDPTAHAHSHHARCLIPEVLVRSHGDGPGCETSRKTWESVTDYLDSPLWSCSPDLKYPVSLTSAADSLPGDASGVLNHVCTFIPRECLKSLPPFHPSPLGQTTLASKTGTWGASHLSALSPDSPPGVSLLLCSLLGHTWPLQPLYVNLFPSLKPPPCPVQGEGLCPPRRLISLLIPDLRSLASFLAPHQKQLWSGGSGRQHAAQTTSDTGCGQANRRTWVLLHFRTGLNRRLTAAQIP